MARYQCVKRCFHVGRIWNIAVPGIKGVGSKPADVLDTQFDGQPPKDKKGAVRHFELITEPVAPEAEKK